MRSGHSLVKPYAPSRERTEELIDQLEARLRWARSLSEMDLRALASEYMMGKRDECSTDAYNEYQRRFPEDGDKVHTSSKKNREAAKKSQRARSSRKGN